MEELPRKKIVRMLQSFAVGGNYDNPSEFTKKVNKNIKILKNSDRNPIIKDIKFSVFSDLRFPNLAPSYLAFILAEVDVNITPEPEVTGRKGKKKKKKKK